MLFSQENVHLVRLFDRQLLENILGNCRYQCFWFMSRNWVCVCMEYWQFFSIEKFIDFSFVCCTVVGWIFYAAFHTKCDGYEIFWKVITCESHMRQISAFQGFNGQSWPYMCASPPAIAFVARFQFYFVFFLYWDFWRVVLPCIHLHVHIQSAVLLGDLHPREPEAEVETSFGKI